MSGFLTGINGESSFMGILRVHAKSPDPVSARSEYWHPERLCPASIFNLNPIS